MLLLAMEEFYFSLVGSKEFLDPCTIEQCKSVFDHRKTHTFQGYFCGWDNFEVEAKGLIAQS